MLTRLATTYSSSCLQVVLVYLQPFRRNSLSKCALQSKIAKNIKIFYFGDLSRLRSLMLMSLKSSTVVFYQ